MAAAATLAISNDGALVVQQVCPRLFTGWCLSADRTCELSHFNGNAINVEPLSSSSRSRFTSSSSHSAQRYVSSLLTIFGMLT